MALLLTTTTLPGLLTKTSWFVTVSQSSRLLRLSTKSQAGATNCSAYAKTSEKNYTHRKLNTHKLSNQNAKKIVINRNEYSYILSIYTNYAKITLYSARHEQQLNTEHCKRKLKQRHVIY